MSEQCVDASVALKWVLKGEKHRSKARALLRDSRNNQIALIAPVFFPYEVDSTIRRLVFEGTISARQAENAFSILDAVPVLIVDPPGIRQRARELAERFNQRSVYDASYAALAELRGCDFWTADEPFYKATAAQLPFVRFLAHYP